jgi:hypothetical protein
MERLIDVIARFHSDFNVRMRELSSQLEEISIRVASGISV